MATIALQGMVFYAYHGVFPEENVTGNRYEVDVHCTLPPLPPDMPDRLDRTVDYGLIYNLVAAEMQQPRKLLETIAVRIGQAILQHCPTVQAVRVRVAKHNPPIKGICASASVEETFVR